MTVHRLGGSYYQVNKRIVRIGPGGRLPTQVCDLDVLESTLVKVGSQTEQYVLWLLVWDQAKIYLC